MSSHLLLSLDGDTWKLLGTGAKREGATYCHLASITRFREQRNGRVPVQIGEWVDDHLLEEAQTRDRAQQRPLRSG